MASCGWMYALVGGRTSALRQEICTRLRDVAPYSDHAAFRQHYELSYLCAVFSHTAPAGLGKVVSENRPEWVLEPAATSERHHNSWPIGCQGTFVVQLLTRYDIPHLDSACACAGFDTGCEAPIHLVNVKDLPIDIELAGLGDQESLNFPAHLVSQFGQPHYGASLLSTGMSHSMCWTRHLRQKTRN